MTPTQLHTWRKARRWNQHQAAAALGLSRTQFQAYEQGRDPIPRRTELAVIAHMAPADLADAVATLRPDLLRAAKDLAGPELADALAQAADAQEQALVGLGLAPDLWLEQAHPADSDPDFD